MKTRSSKPAGKSVRFTLRLRGDLRERVKRVAKIQERSEAWVVEKCITRGIDSMESQKPTFNQAEFELTGLLAA